MQLLWELLLDVLGASSEWQVAEQGIGYGVRAALPGLH